MSIIVPQNATMAIIQQVLCKDLLSHLCELLASPPGSSSRTIACTIGNLDKGQAFSTWNRLCNILCSISRVVIALTQRLLDFQRNISRSENIGVPAFDTGLDSS